MNAIFQSQNRPSATAVTSSTTVGRIAHHPICADALARFNAALCQLGRVPMALSELDACARRHAPLDRTGQASAWIVRRMRRGLTVGLMLADPSWMPAGRSGEAAGIVVEYLGSSDDLIPDALPRIGRLDDALMVEAAWPLLAGEVRAYLDYCGVRRIEAGLRGCAEHAFTFSRTDAHQARQAQRGLARHFDRVALRSYLPTARTSRFRVC